MYCAASFAPGVPVRRPSSASEARYVMTCRTRSTLELLVPGCCANTVSDSTATRIRVISGFICLNLIAQPLLFLCVLRGRNDPQTTGDTEKSLNPIRDTNIRVTLLRAVTIRSEDQLLAVRREHRKTIKRVVIGNALQPRSVRLDRVEIEIAAFRIGIIRGENNALAVGKEVRRKARFVKVRDI